MDVKPGNAATIIECDINLEFDAPEGYVEPSASRDVPQVRVLALRCYSCDLAICG